MSRGLAVLALFLASLGAAAQEQAHADLSVTAAGFDPVRRTGQYIYGGFVVTNHGPATARGIRIDFSASPKIPGYLLGERRPFDLAPGKTETFSLRDFYAPVTAGRITFAAEVSAATSDPDPSNNRTAVEIEVLLQLDLRVHVEPRPGYQPEAVGTIDVVHYTYAHAPAATNVVVTVEFPEDVPIVGRTGDERFRCEIDWNRAVCRADSLPVTTWFENPRSHFTFRVPPLYDGGTFDVRATIRGDEPDFDRQGDVGYATVRVFKFFRVTNTADDGPGSLREAIHSANAADCSKRCTVGFRIPDPLPERGYFTIQPRSPLPAVRFDGFVSGNAQKDLPGNEGATPRVMIDGSLAGSGDGLVLQRSVDVDGLAIGNFPRFGVLVEGLHVTPRLDGVYLGVDAGGATAAPNFRGLVTNRAGVRMTNCVVSGNVRSGIVADGAILIGNRIGVAAGSDLPIPNGASGVYLPGRGYATLSGNVIAHNREFAVALDAGLRGVTMTRNAIFGNGLGIDYGLDGTTANAFDQDRFPNHPVIESARFDAATNQTIIAVRLATNAIPPLYDVPLPVLNSSLTFTAEVYANRTPEGQAERFLGVVAALSHTRVISEIRTLTVDGDLRGQWISAVGTRKTNDCYLDLCSDFTSTSESSPTAPVQ